MGGQELVSHTTGEVFVLELGVVSWDTKLRSRVGAEVGVSN
jgi:hypothetical protein